jgi:hypothetical protein
VAGGPVPRGAVPRHLDGSGAARPLPLAGRLHRARDGLDNRGHGTSPVYLQPLEGAGDGHARGEGTLNGTLWCDPCPRGSGAKLVAIALCHCGPLDVGEAATRPIQAFGSRALEAVGPLTYCQLNAMLDAAYPKGALNYWKSNFLAQLSDAAIDTMIECFARCPSPMGQILLEHLHGAATRVGIGDPAFPTSQTATTFSWCLNGWTRPIRIGASPGLGTPVRQCSPSWPPAATPITRTTTSRGAGGRSVRI